MSNVDLEKNTETNAQTEALKHLAQIPFPAFSAYSGPIPPPEHLARYDKMVPGIAKKFLEEPHLEAEHRRSLDIAMVEAQIKISKRGQWMAYSLALVCVAGSFAAIFSGHSIWGLGALLLSIGGFIGVFMYGKNQKSS